MRRPAAISLAAALDRSVGRPLYLRPQSAQNLAEVLMRRVQGVRADDAARERVAAVSDSRGRAADAALREARLDESIVVVGESRGELPPPSYRLIDDIAVVSVVGTLCKDDPGMMASFGPFTVYDDVVRTVDAAVSDARVGGVMLVVDSPGGEAAGCIDAVDDLLLIREHSPKPIASFACGMAASAGYAMLMCASPGMVSASDNSDIGSIGSVQLVDEIRTGPEDRYIRHVVSSGVFKAAHSPHTPKDEGTMAYIQQGIDDCAAVFIDRVQRARGLDPHAVAALEGALVQGFRAQPLGLIDRACSLREAMDALRDAIAPRAATTQTTDPAAAPQTRAPVVSPFSRAPSDQTPRQEKAMSFLSTLRAPRNPRPRLAEDDTEETPAPPGGGESEEGEPMTADQLREKYPEAVAQIEEEAVAKARSTEEEEDQTPPDAGSSAKPENSAAASPASLADLRAAFGADPAFVLEAVDKGLTMPQASAQFAARMQTALDAARKEAAQAKASLMALGQGAPPVQTGVRPSNAAHAGAVRANGRSAEQMLADPACVAAYRQMHPSFDPANPVQRAGFLSFVRGEIADGREPFPDTAD